MGRRPHVLAIAYPAQGHIGPLMKLSNLIADRGIKVTFVNAVSVHARVLAAMSNHGEVVHNLIDIVSIPDGLDPQDGRKDRIQLSESMLRVMPGHLEDLINKINLSTDDEKITCVIADATIGWVLDTAEKMGIQKAMFWPTIVSGFALALRIQELTEAKIIDQNGTPVKKNEMTQISPGLPGMSSSEFIWNCPGDPVRQKIIFGYVAGAKKAVKISNWLLCNSFQELDDPSTCALIPNLLSIGPLLSINHPGKPVGNFWSEDSCCLQWLDKQPPQSVIYVAFGSITLLSQHQFEELALGLELVGKKFLWVVRSDVTDGSVIEYPDGFLQRVAGFGKIIKWAPQEKVLAHSSIACFLSHCGWNSSIEGISMGVPFLCWPYFADQFLIRSYICDVWKVGLGLNPEKNGIISRHEIKRKLDNLLCDGCIRENVMKVKELARKSVSEGGSSMQNFEFFIEQIGSD